MKKRMKQVLALGVAVMLVLGGCTEKPEEPVVEETPKVEEGEGIEVVEEETESIVPEKQAVPLSVSIDTNQKTYYFEDGEKAYLYLQYCDVTVEGGENVNLKKNIENWSMERSEQLRSEALSFESDAAENLKNTGDFFNNYSLYQRITTSRIDSQVVSLLENTDYYTGGAHGMFCREGINFDAQSGKRLNLSEIFSDYEGFQAVATEKIIDYLKTNYEEELFPDYIEMVEGLWADELGPEWYFDGSGIVIIIQQYLVGPASVGAPEIHLPYAEMKQYIKEIYLPDDSDGVSKFEKNQEIFLQISELEEELPMMLQYKDIDGIPSCALWLGNQKKTMEGFTTLTNSYLLRNHGEIFCLIEVDFASDDYVTYIYRLTEGRIQEIDQLKGSISMGNINSDKIVMEFWVNLLGTYGGVKNYRFDENQEFVTEDTEYRLSENQVVLTTMVDLPVILEETDSILPAGSHIVLNSTDGESFVKFTIQETGQTGVLLVQRAEGDYYNVSINGINESECFEFLPYAG